MTANVDAMVREAIRAYKAGQKAEAHALLLKATELDQMHEQAWMWLSAVVDTPEDQRICLENVIYINPDNENARRGLALLNKQPGGSTSTSTAPFAGDVSDEAVFDSPDVAVESPFAEETDRTPAEHQAYANIFAESFEPGFADDRDAEEDVEQVAAFDLFDAGSFDKDIESEEDIFADVEESLITEGPFSAAALDFDLDVPAKADKDARAAAKPKTATRSPVTDTSKPRTQPDRDHDPADYFEMIPSTIKATRLPGTDETYPVWLIPGLVALVVLNLVALALLFA